MSSPLNRRSFLQSLIALGASYALSSNATPQEVAKVWKEALAKPWYFSVGECGTITEPDYPRNETWGEIIKIGGAYLRTPEEVIREVERCQPLTNHFAALAEKELESLIEELNGLNRRSVLRRRHIAQVIKALEDDSCYGWCEWVRLEGTAGVKRFKDEITAWENEPADYAQSDYFPTNHGAQGQAMEFIESLGHKTSKALGVVIVEGEHPGSTYYAAELRKGIAAANEAAAALELPFRFKA